MSLNRLPEAAARLVPNLSVLTNNPTSLYKTLSRLPRNGVGAKIIETRWAQKNFKDCYWVVSRSHLKLDGAHGKAYGQLHWRGTCAPEPISVTYGLRRLPRETGGHRSDAQQSSSHGGPYSWRSQAQMARLYGGRHG